MNLWQSLTEKSWLANPNGAAAMAGGNPTDYDAKRIALYFFLATATVFFSLFVVTFLSHSQYPDFQPLTGEPWKPFSNTGQLWFNTGLLLLSSVSIHIGLIYSRKQQLQASLIAVIIAVFFTLQFLLAQVWLWFQVDGMGYGLRSNPSSSYFYLLTALHGLHLIAGVAVLGRTLWWFWVAAPSEKLVGSIKLCTTYWHYLLIVWLALFALLTASPETYQTLAAMCGF